VAELAREAGIGIVVALCAFGGTLGAVGIVIGNLGHAKSPGGARLGARTSGNSELAEAFAGLQRFVGFGIALDDVAEFRDTVFLLAQLD